MAPNLVPYNPPRSDRGIPCWNLGTVEISQTAARALLGDPHYEELDYFRTSGGTEDHWTFLSPTKLPIFFRLCVPYDKLFVHGAAQTVPENIWELFGDIFPNCVFDPLEKPFNEMAHPLDPEFYYQN